MTAAPPPRRVLLLVNPKSGSGNAEWARFKDVLSARGIESVERVLDDPERNPEHVRGAGEFEAAVVAGGDGTVSSVAYELRDSGVPLLAFPAGTANLIAQNLNLPTGAEGLADVLDAGATVRTDLAEISAGNFTWGFALIAGLGADALMIRDSEHLKPSLGAGAYLVGALRQIAFEQARFKLEIDGHLVETDGSSVMVANFGMANFRLPLARGIDPTDGLLNVIVVKSRTPLSLLPHLLDSVRGRLNLGEPLFEGQLETYTCREVVVRADRALPLQFDGEAREVALPVRARVLPLAATFLSAAKPEDLTT